jgi:hypothetical protein
MGIRRVIPAGLAELLVELSSPAPLQQARDFKLSFSSMR